MAYCVKTKLIKVFFACCSEIVRLRNGNRRNLVSYKFRGCESEVWVQGWFSCGEGPLPGLGMAPFSPCPLFRECAWVQSPPPFLIYHYSIMIPYFVTSLKPGYFPWTSSEGAITLGIMASTWEHSVHAPINPLG